MPDIVVIKGVSFDPKQLARLDERCREIRRSRSYAIRIAVAKWLREPIDPAIRRELALLDDAPSPRRGK